MVTWKAFLSESFVMRFSIFQVADKHLNYKADYYSLQWNKCS